LKDVKHRKFESFLPLTGCRKYLFSFLSFSSRHALPHHFHQLWIQALAVLAHGAGALQDHRTGRL
jgi:hypothetical protein